jgi:hypothetical protein
MQRILTCGLCCLVIFLQACRKVTENSVSNVRNGDYQVLVRSQEINTSGIHNVDVCVAKASDSVFPKDKKQCFLHGFDFSELSVNWKSKNNIEVSFQCGRVDQFRNSAFVYPQGPVPEEFYVTLRDSCNTATK